MSSCDRVGLDPWEISAWIGQFGSMPVSKVCGADFSQPFTARQARGFLLENGGYALVVEEGCSCYTTGDAEIELFPSEERLMVVFNRWVRQQEGYGHARN